MLDPVIIVLALLTGVAVHRVGLPPLLGYLVAGFMAHAIGVEGGELIDQIANAGITLLLFTIGLKLNLRDLAAPQVWGVAGAHMLVSIPVLAAVMTGLALLLPDLPAIDNATLWAMALALSFSSTVFAVKIFDERGEGAALHAKLAIGILIVQDLVAVVFLALSSGKVPDWTALLLLLLIPLRPLLLRLFTISGHGELLTLFGIGVAFGGAELFELFNVKGDLGALLLGVLLGGSNKTTELGKTLLTLKDLFLAGFFISIGLKGFPSADMMLFAVCLGAIAVFKPVLYYLLFVATRLRARTSLLASLSLYNYSEFGLIVAALAVSSGMLDSDWMVAIALALAVSFFVAAPLNACSRQLYRRYHKHLYERPQRLAIELPVDIGNASIIVLGMGRVGRGAYSYLADSCGEKLVGVEELTEKYQQLKAEGLNVVHGDANDMEFWEEVNLDKIELILVSLTNHSENIDVCNLLDDLKYKGKTAVIARFPDELNELSERGCIAFNLYGEAGHGFAEHVINSLNGEEERQVTPTE